MHNDWILRYAHWGYSRHSGIGLHTSRALLPPLSALSLSPRSASDTHVSLTSIHLRKGDIGVESSSAIVQAIAVSRSLRSINLQYCIQYNDELVVSELKRACKRDHGNDVELLF